MDFLRKVLKKQKKEAVNVMPFITAVKEEFTRRKVQVDVRVGGSLAKNTHLGIHDIDIFVRFEKKVDSGLLEKVLKKICISVERIHGSRDYFHAHFKGFKGVHFEVVPVLHIKKPEDAENTTDVSVFHVDWVTKHLKTPDEVRLAKLFCKSHRVYGAESYIQGFSGYVLEILIVRYGSFLKLMQAGSTWRLKEVIDVAKHYSSEMEVLKSINESKLESPLIIVDPIDKKRNAAAALSTEKWVEFVDACREFIRKPTESHFIERNVDVRHLQQLARHHASAVYFVQFTTLEGRGDIVLSKVRLCFTYLRSQLKLFGFDINSSGVDWERKFMWYEIAEPLSPVEKIDGPVVWASPHHAAAFKQKYKDWHVSGHRYVAFQKRKFTTAWKLIQVVLKDPYITEKVKKARLAKL